ncbi:MAG: AsmA-like C-terminal region-containing protein, partial [Verrucomicrobiota bacterium]
MRKYAKYILIAAGLFLLVYLLAILGLNIYLQSEGLQKRIQVAAESAAGSPVRIHGTHYTPWSGFSINGISINGTSVRGQPPLLEATSVSFRFSLLSLLRGKLLVSEVVVTDPSFVSLGAQPRPAPGPGEPEPNPAPSATPRTEVADHPATGVEISVPTPAPPPASPVEVRRVRIANGKASIFDSKGALALTLTGVEISAEVMPDRSVAGTFLIVGTTVGAFVHPSDVKGTFVWRNGRLTIPDLRAAWAGGQLTGTVEIGPDRGVSVIAAAEGILIKKLAEDAGINGDGSRGSLFSKGTFNGISGKPETFAGRVDVSLQQARFQPLDLIRQIGDLMGIQELQMLELKTAEAGFNIHDKKVSVEALVLESENLVIDAKGPVGFDGKMKLQARLHLNERLRKDLAGFLGDNFKESERAGYQQ